MKTYHWSMFFMLVGINNNCILSKEAYCENDCILLYKYDESKRYKTNEKECCKIPPGCLFVDNCPGSGDNGFLTKMKPCDIGTFKEYWTTPDENLCFNCTVCPPDRTEVVTNCTKSNDTKCRCKDPGHFLVGKNRCLECEVYCDTNSLGCHRVFAKDERYVDECQSCLHYITKYKGVNFSCDWKILDDNLIRKEKLQENLAETTSDNSVLVTYLIVVVVVLAGFVCVAIVIYRRRQHNGHIRETAALESFTCIEEGRDQGLHGSDNPQNAHQKHSVATSKHHAVGPQVTLPPSSSADYPPPGSPSPDGSGDEVDARVASIPRPRPLADDHQVACGSGGSGERPGGVGRHLSSNVETSGRPGNSSNPSDQIDPRRKVQLWKAEQDFRNKPCESDSDTESIMTSAARSAPSEVESQVCVRPPPASGPVTAAPEYSSPNTANAIPGLTRVFSL